MADTIMNSDTNAAKQPIMRPLTPTQLTQAVSEVGGLHLEGNVVPHVWYQHPVFQVPCGKGDVGHTKAYIDAILLLSDVLYWYRPTVVRDEYTGEVKEVRRKFSASMLQKNYETWGKQFGMAKWRVQDAMKFLREKKLLRVELMAVQTQGGLQGNVVFMEPILTGIRASLRLPEDAGNGSEPAGDPGASPDQDTPPSPDNGGPLSAITGRGVGDYQERSRLLPPHSYITAETTAKNTHTVNTTAPPAQGAVKAPVVSHEQAQGQHEQEAPPAPKRSAPNRTAKCSAPAAEEAPPDPAPPNASQVFRDAFTAKTGNVPHLAPEHHKRLQQYRLAHTAVFEQSVAGFLASQVGERSGYDVTCFLGKTPNLWLKILADATSPSKGQHDDAPPQNGYGRSGRTIDRSQSINPGVDAARNAAFQQRHGFGPEMRII